MGWVIFGGKLLAITISQATSADAREMIDLWRYGAKSGNWAFIGSTSIPAKTELANLRRELASKTPTTVRLIARDNTTGKLVGNIAGAWRHESRMRHVISCGWGVHPDFQRQGIGTALLSALITYARMQGFKRMEAEIAIENIASLRLAAKLGFIQESVRKLGFITDDCRFIDTITVVLIL